ncbi:MAG TPA: LytTR family DNA-binding domain-containing protein [Steroidobacteraceae bacterium]|jgi:two-component system LytT family response regulator
MKLTALVADDEPLARRRLAALIADVPWLQQVGEAGDGVEAVALAQSLHPDVLFLDIRMPELSGIEVVQQLRRLPASPLVIFTTAYDQHAVVAFELGAVDYLLKPFGASRFQAAIERARSARPRDNANVLARAQDALTRPDGGAPFDRIFVREGNAIVPVRLAAVERAEAQDDYVMIHAGQRRHLMSLRIRDLEAWLPNPPFLRVHRSHIVNLDHVDRMFGLDGARFEILMKNGAVVPASRARSQEIRRRSR